MSYRVTMFGNHILSTYVDQGQQSNLGTGQAQHGYAQATDGSYFDNYGPYRRLPSTLQSVNKSLLVVADTAAELSSSLGAMRALLGTRDRLTIHWKDGWQWWQWARCVQVDVPAEYNHLTHAVVNIAWVTEDQHWFGTINGDAWEWDEDAIWDAGIAEWDMTSQTYVLDGSPKSITLENDGNLEAQALRIEIDVPTGGDPITAVTVVNNASRTRWVYAGGAAINADQRLYVDGGERRAVHMAAYKTVTEITQSGRLSTATAVGHGYTFNEQIFMDPDAGGLSLENAGFFELESKTTDTFTYVNHRGVAETPAGAQVRKVTNMRAHVTPDRVKEWLTLSPGDNDLEVTYTGNSSDDATVSFVWSDRHA